MARRPAQSTTIERQIKALRMRVSFLERALKPVKKNEQPLDGLNQKRDRAEDEARRKALSDYHHQKRIEFYLRHPGILAAELAAEHEQAEFLKSRGLEPEPSRIPKQFHRGLKRYRPGETDR